ncbi:heavy-metal-associated domain-containing protein [Haladaptatus halobius]|uniref:heavy-metal-associated domain-containing protein n=1 Tax=Haladaptatus halobius TaxID=2884875 RepID=UPI001D0B3DE8|nr:heavy metal-associated domain-containing protein [Haladaptatus halobius]
MEKHELQVNGIDCIACTQLIEQKLKKIEGVNKVATDLEDGIVTITVNDSETGSFVEYIVKDIGYDVLSHTS